MIAFVLNIENRQVQRQKVAWRLPEPGREPRGLGQGAKTA